MSNKHHIRISVICQDQHELQQALNAILYHLEPLNPNCQFNDNTLTIHVIPIDPAYFALEEAQDIIQQTLAPDLPPSAEWKCTTI